MERTHFCFCVILKYYLCLRISFQIYRAEFQVDATSKTLHDHSFCHYFLQLKATTNGTSFTELYFLFYFGEEVDMIYCLFPSLHFLK